MGLPGSGKTHWVLELTDGYYNEPFRSRSDNSRYYSIDLDSYVKRKFKEIEIKQKLSGVIRTTHYTHAIVDGLLLTYSDVEKLLSLLDSDDWSYVSQIVLHWWKPDVEMCLLNDKGRRSENASITIKNAKFEEPDREFIEKLREKFPILKDKKVEAERHSIVLKPSWKAFAEEYDMYINRDGQVRSDTWSLGGTWRDCWDNQGTVSAEAEPNTFREFDNLLEKICPNISFLQYKSLYSEVVHYDTDSEGDYYGGSVTYAYRFFYPEALYNALKQRELI